MWLLPPSDLYVCSVCSFTRHVVTLHCLGNVGKELLCVFLGTLWKNQSNPTVFLPRNSCKLIFYVKISIFVVPHLPLQAGLYTTSSLKLPLTSVVEWTHLTFTEHMVLLLLLKSLFLLGFQYIGPPVPCFNSPAPARSQSQSSPPVPLCLLCPWDLCNMASEVLHSFLILSLS